MQNVSRRFVLSPPRLGLAGPRGVSRVQRPAVEAADLHQAEWRAKATIEHAGGDVQPARRLASGEGGQAGERDMHRGLRGIAAAVELPLRPGEMLVARVGDG